MNNAESREAISQATEDAILAIEEAGKRVEINTRDTIQEKIASWMKVSTVFVSIALVVLMFFGYQEASNFTAEIKRNLEDAEDYMVEIRVKHNIVNEEAANVLALKEEMNNYLHAQQALIVKADNMIKDLNTNRVEDKLSFDQIQTAMNATLDEMKQQYKDLKEQLDDINLLKNALITIHVLYFNEQNNDDSMSQLAPLFRALEDRGFIISPENVLTMQVDKSELLYYSDQTSDALSEIEGLVVTFLQQAGMGSASITQREVAGKSWGQRDIVIKLRL